MTEQLVWNTWLTMDSDTAPSTITSTPSFRWVTGYTPQVPLSSANGSPNLVQGYPLTQRRLRTTVETALADTPVVCVLGGKTTLVRQFEPEYTFTSLDDPAAQAGKDFRGGVLLYAGTSTLPLETERCLAVPLARLWDQ